MCHVGLVVPIVMPEARLGSGACVGKSNCPAGIDRSLSNSKTFFSYSDVVLFQIIALLLQSTIVAQALAVGQITLLLPLD